MSPLQWVLLCLLFTLYLLFGGSVFMYFEQHREIEKKEEISVLRKDINEILLQLDKDFYHNDTTKEVINALTTAKMGVIYRISAACDLGDLLAEDSPKPVSAPAEDEHHDKLKWSFYNSVFFAFTVVTTIGYGHLSPSASWSKWFVMIYALIGIPINSILLSGVGDYFASKLVKVHKKSKEKPERRCTLFFEILLYLIPGIIVFIIVPAGIFVLIEKWTFLDAIYYAFVSLTTIGFGDYVAGMGNGHTVWMWVYKAFIIIWITFGLGYLIMILGFISKGMTHKKVRVVIEKRLNTIRVTKEKLSRDIDYMRRVVNELYLMKVKPVYEYEKNGEEDFKSNVERTKSQPCIRNGKRYSDSFQSIGPVSKADETFASNKDERRMSKLTRRCSDSDLSQIDRDKTFETAIQQHVTVDELLVTVVNALSGNVMNEVMEAVDELNCYEDEELSKEYEKHPVENVYHSKEHNGGGGGDFEELPRWDLGSLSESDEEVLIVEDVDGGLAQVVVHDSKNSNQNLVNRVTGAIRKISPGHNSPADGPSRKVSRNESFKRRISRNNSYEKNISGHQRCQPFINPLAYAQGADRKLSPYTSNKRKISQESKISNFSTSSLISTEGVLNSTVSSRKISPASINDDHRSKISLESTSLAEFLQALDNVHCRLNAKTSVQSMGVDSIRSAEFPCTTSSFNSRASIRRSERKPRISESSINLPRRRKNGVIHPDFAYVNDSFLNDDDGKQEKGNSPQDSFSSGK